MGRMSILRAAVLVLLLPGLSVLSAIPAQAAPSVPTGTGPSEGNGPSWSPRASGKADLGLAVALTRAGGTDYAFVSAPYRNNGAGIVSVYTRSSSGFRRQATIADPDGPQGLFGTRIAASGGRLAIVGKTGVHLYQLSGSAWQPQGTVPGVSVAMSGSTMVIGGVAGDGSAAFYVRSNGTWTRQAVFNRHPESTGGTVVAISGSTVVTGSFNVAYIYAKAGPGWVRQARLTGAGLFFGGAVAVLGSTVVVGSWGARNYHGLAYIYRRSGRKWTRVARFTNPNHTRLGTFGYSVAMSGRRMLIAAPSNISKMSRPRPACGAAYEYLQIAGHWRYQAKLTNPGCQRGDAFGWAMATAGRTAVIGAPYRNRSHGAVYELTIR
jgi:FG-GAP repeat